MGNIHRRLVGTLLLLLAAAAARPISAGAQTVLFDDFGPAYAFSLGVPRYSVDGDGGFQAFRFFATGSGALTSLTVALGRTGMAQTATRFLLYDGASATGFGALLASFDMPNAATPSTGGVYNGEAVTQAATASPYLTAGSAYWLSFTDPEAPNGASSLWFSNSLGLTGTRLTDVLPASPGYALPAFRLEGRAASTIPEPRSLALLVTGLGLLGLGYLAQGRTQARSS